MMDEPKARAAPTRSPVTPDSAIRPRPGSETVRTLNPMEALDRLSLLLNLQRRARMANPEELPFIMTNESRQLVPFRQSALFSVRRGRSALQAVSGLAIPDRNAPYAQWLGRFVRWRLAAPDAAKIQRIDFPALAADTATTPSWLPEWKEWLPPHMIWAPLPDGRGGLCGMLLFCREEPYADAEFMLAAHLAETYGMCWSLARSRPARGGRQWFSPLIAVLACIAVAAGFYPVRQTVLAPAEVTARRPALVRSGLDGVVDRFMVEPNQRVDKGDPLVRLEDAQLRTRLAVARKAEDMAQAEYRQLMQAALSDPKSKQRIPLAQGRIEQLNAETAYIESLMERVVIHSPLRGGALCDNPDEWLGRPVSLGQRIMLVADPDDLQLEITLPAAEALQAGVGDRIVFFPNVAPISPMEATVTFVGYRAGEVPGVGMAFILRAEISGDGKPLLGLRGMAKLYGPEQPLALNILRKPLMAARQWLGL